jgi:primosomal protein N' (replication factor Y)
MQVAELIVLTNAPNRYTYAVPQGLSLVVGDFVDVLFSKRAQVGCVMRLADANEDDFSYRLSVIQSRHETRLPIPPFLLQMVEWFSQHYCVTEYRALQCMVGQKKHRSDEFKPVTSNKLLQSLSDEQQKVFDSIVDSSQLSHLLHGVTGSGKTQIYAHLIQVAIQGGQSAIVLIPEISLTPQFTSFFSDIFSRVAVVHSGLTPKKKEIIWNQCLRGEIDVIVGPRSAIFMPLENLGLIIVDEEHDGSYKQDSTPRYYTHQVAMRRSNIHQARLVFGSATPSLTTFFQSQQKQLIYHSLTKRFNDISMPNVIVLDMASSQKHHLIHDRLLEQIETKLKKNQKVLLLVNRRGYSSFLKCNGCGAIQDCKACQTSYTYHSDGYFRCHRCLATKKMSRQCADCGQYDVEYYGIAIQKIAYELNHLFPTAKLTRIDRDTVKNYDALQQALSDVDAADILIGTQMISKGHNFSNVALVGMIGVDTMLNFPDFRASERMFQLMTQMAGRAGRDMSGSDVYIQTFQPNHYVFSFVKGHDVSGFLHQESSFRKPFGYPPYKALVNIIISSTDNRIVQSMYSKIDGFNASLKKRFDLSIIGPKVAPIEKVSGYFRHNVFYKISLSDVDRFKEQLLNFPKKSGVRFVIDIDPQSLL